MVWYWLMVAVRWFARLFVMPRPENVLTRRADAKCAACGAREGRLRCVHRAVGENRTPRVFVQHTCAACGARTYEDPIRKVSVEQVEPSLPRTRLEKYEDLMSSSMNQSRTN